MAAKFHNIIAVCAEDIPDNAVDWLLDKDVSTHYQNDIIQVEDDGNPFAEWLKENGYIFKYLDDGNEYTRWDNIGIFAT